MKTIIVLFALLTATACSFYEDDVGPDVPDYSTAELQCRELAGTMCEIEYACGYDAERYEYCYDVIEERCPLNQTVLAPQAMDSCLLELKESEQQCRPSGGVELTEGATVCVTIMLLWEGDE